MGSYNTIQSAFFLKRKDTSLGMTCEVFIKVGEGTEQHTQKHVALLYAATETTLLEDYEDGEVGGGDVAPESGNGLDVSGLGAGLQGEAGYPSPGPGLPPEGAR